MAITPTTEVLIIGGGPAGLTAALTLARLHHTVKIFDNGDFRNKATKTMALVIAMDGVNPTDFRDKAIDNLLSNHKNVSLVETTIAQARKLEDGSFEVEDESGKTWQGKKLILATGSVDIFPNIEGYADFWGNGIYHCYFYKGYTEKKAESSGILAVDIMEDPWKSMHAARYATQISEVVTIYTNGNAELAEDFKKTFNGVDKFRTDTRKIKKFKKDNTGSKVAIEFDDGTEVIESFVGHYPLSKAKGKFAEQLGLPVLPSGDIATNQPWLQTDIKGVFACGDNSQPRKIVPEAQNSGSLVGAAVSNQIIAETFGQQGLV